MKKSLVFLALIGILSVFFLVFAGCKSAPPASEPTIWDLLLARDASARGYFLGEVEVNQTDEAGKTPLHYAAEMKDAQLAGFFISIGANVNALDLSRRSPLGISVENNDSATASIIARAGADIHLPIIDNATISALALAEENIAALLLDGETETAKALADETASIRANAGKTAAEMALAQGSFIFRSILTPSNMETVNAKGMTVLHMASFAGNVQAVQSILELSSGSNAGLIGKRDKEDKNPLDYALERPDSKNHMLVAEQLILAGAYSENPVFNYFGPAVRSANYNIRRNEGLAPIHYAVMNDYTGLITFLLEKNIDINIKSTSGATALHEAVRVGNINVINMLVNAGADVNSRDGNSNTPLHMGSPAEVHRETAVLLIGKGADPNLRDAHGDTPLHIAIILNRPLNVIEAFIDGKSDVYIRNIQGQTPLYIAVREERTALIPVLLASGSEIFAADDSGVTPFDMAVSFPNTIFNLMIVPETVNQRDSAGNTMLHAAVRNRANPLQIARILDNRALVDARNRDGDTALHIAVRMNQKESGEFLISRGANIFSLNSAGQSPLFLALSGTSIREWIINPATINAKDGLGNSILHYAAEWKLNNVIPIIIRNGLSVEEENATGETPIFMAVKTNSPPTIKILLDNNANINARDTQGQSLLHTALRWNAKDSAQMLINNNIDINSQALNGNTPLHDAIIFRMPEIENMLISNHANLETRNIDGITPLMEAVRHGSSSSVERLTVNMADVSARNTRGDTPLHLAVSMENFDIVNILLRRGASIHARNTRERTPFQISLKLSPEMVSALLTADRINVSDDLGFSALHIALQEKSPSEILRTILVRGARTNAVDSNGRTPLRFAVDMDLWESAKVIADSGADPYIIAADGKTAAEISFVKGEDCIRALFSGRAVNSRDSSGNTILHMAAQKGNPATISLLIELGANKNIRNISHELPYDIALRWNRTDNADLLK